MKKISIKSIHFIHQTVLGLFISLLLVIPFELIAQEDSTSNTEEVSLISPTLRFVSIQKSDNSIDLKTSLIAKINGWPMKLQLLKISFFQLNNEEEKEIGFIITDKSGKGQLNIKADAVTPDQEGKLTFKAVFAGNKSMESVEEELTIKRARLEMTPVKEDSLLMVHVKMIDIGNGSEAPIPDATVGIFVNRLFKPLKIGEGTTDENGEASVEIRNNLPGNGIGEITLLAKVDEDEVFGNLEASSNQQWGVPVSQITQNQPRALWSKNPPIWMLITFIVLMTVVWGHYIVIVYELFRLRKEQPKT